MKKMLLLMSIILFTTILVQAQKTHTESEYKSGYIPIAVQSDTIKSKHDAFFKVNEWAVKKYQGVIYTSTESTIHVETDDYLLFFTFNKVGMIYFEFRDKGEYGKQPFGKKQNVIADLSKNFMQ
jgi:hypothetical protein